MARKREYKGTLAIVKVEETLVRSSEISKLFDKMLDNLYHESASIRRKSEVSPRTLSIRFGSDY